MSVKPIIPSIDSNNNNAKIKQNAVQIRPLAPSAGHRVSQSKQVSFQGANPIVGLMDFIAAGGYAAAFIIQDGLGFVAPRVGKGLLRGGKEKRDENGNVVLDKDGKPKHELNWAYARKEGIREIVTGPSAFIIPYLALKYINKHYGAGNNVKLNYIDGFKAPFTNFVSNNLDVIKNGEPPKQLFYEEVFKDVINRSVNDVLPDAEKMKPAEIADIAKEYAQRQVQIEGIKADKSLNKKAKAEALSAIESVEDSFMKLKKGKIGGTVNELAINITSSNGSLKGGSIGELLGAMNDYFGDAASNMKKALKDSTTAEQIENAMKSFTHKRMGTRVLTNLGLFGVVAAFYTQIPKLYNMGLKGNPALQKEENHANTTAEVAKDTAAAPVDKSKVPFTGWNSFLERTGEKMFNGKKSKSISDLFELNGPVISGSAMPVLLYGFCIPPRLKHAQDKYDYGEIVVRDMTAFTALLFGAKALARLFSDGFTKITGLALNHKDMDGKSVWKKVVGYLNPHDTIHSVLTSKQLQSKYTNLEDYKGGVNGFMEFIEKSGGNVKKAFAQDKNIKSVVENILQGFNGKSFADATVGEIKDALRAANNNKDGLIKDFYKLFKGDNGLLRRAKTCNSTFDFLSTLVLVPGLIIWLTDVCEKMTNKRTAKDKADAQAKKAVEMNRVSQAKLASTTPSMEGFLGKAIR